MAKTLASMALLLAGVGLCADFACVWLRHSATFFVSLYLLLRLTWYPSVILLSLALLAHLRTAPSKAA